MFTNDAKTAAAVAFAAFFPGAKALQISPLGKGNINDTYLVEPDRGALTVLQRINHHVFRQPEAVIENMSLVEAHLCGKTDYPLQILQMLALPEGGFLHKNKMGDYWRAFPCFSRTYTIESSVGADTARDVATAYGAFSKALLDFPAESLHTVIPGFHDTMLRWQHFEAALAADIVGRAANCRPEVDAMWEMHPVFAQIDRLKKEGGLPLRVTHNDTKTGNILFDYDTRRPLVVLDLDTVMPGTLLSDFGDMVRTCAPDRYEDEMGRVGVRIEVLEALQEGFCRVLDEHLHVVERENLMLGALWIIGEQALRFLTDHLNGDTYFKTRHKGHNLLRAQNQISLYRALADHLRV
jgi:hypothetical protein